MRLFVGARLVAPYSNDSMTILTLRNVSKVFANPDNGTDKVHAIENVSLEVQAGEFFSIIGPSGCGKSTLLRIIGGLLSATSGELTVGTERVDGRKKDRKSVV